MKKIYISLLLLCASFPLILSCGGGSESSDSVQQADFKVSINTDTITAKTGEVPIEILMDLSCESDELFSSECTASKVVVSVGNYKSELPLNLTIKGGESDKVKLTLFSQSDLLMPPFNYLFDENPSNSVTEWSTYTEVIGEMKTELLAKTTETCVTTENPPSNTCTPDKIYQFTLPPYTPGTLKISERTNVLEEVTMGTLIGNGTGYISNGIAYVTLSYDPPKDSDIIAVYVSPLKKLNHMPYGEDIRLNYGTLTLNQNGNLLSDSKGDTYANIDGDSIVFVRSPGFKNSPMVVSYSGDPYMTSGGEFAGYGDGINTTYQIATKYAPVKSDTFSVFTPEQPGVAISSNLSTGVFTVKFERAPTKDEKIFVSYVLSQASAVIGVQIMTSDGYPYFTIPIDLTR